MGMAAALLVIPLMMKRWIAAERHRRLVFTVYELREGRIARHTYLLNAEAAGLGGGSFGRRHHGAK
jgi:hypothetical protein